MGGKRNKSKKFLRQRFNKKHNKQNKKKNAENNNKHNMMKDSSVPNKQKKSKDLFNAGINALNEQPQIDVGLMYSKSDGYNPNDNHDDINNYDQFNEDNISTSGDIGFAGLGGGGGGGDKDGGSEMDISDVMSLQSEVTILDDEILNLQDNDHLIDNEIDDLLDDLTNIDSNIRIQSIKKLNNELRTRRTNEYDFTDKNQRLQLVSKHLANILRKGSKNQQLHALDTISLLALSLNEGLDFFMKYFQNMLKSLIQRPKSAIVQIKAINTWAVMVWSFGDGGSKIATLKLFEYFWNYNLKKHEDEENDYNDYYEDDEEDNDDDDDNDDEEKENESNKKQRASTEILTAAIDAWLFLITSIGNSSNIGSLLDTYCQSLLQLLRLESTTITEKIHIGKALTVLIDNYNNAIENDIDFESQDVNLDAIMNEFNHLKSNSKQHRRKEFLNQKAKFRDYLKTLEHKWTPLIVIKLHHKKFQLSGWNQWVQYHYIKQTLQNGLQAHLLQNIKIKDTFNIEIDAEPIEISKTEKKSKKIENIENERKIKKDRWKRRDSKRGFIFDKNMIDQQSTTY